MPGPLSGIQVIEVAGIGPAPFAGMVLSDLGADVIRVDRTRNDRRERNDAANVHDRGRRSVAVDLKHPDGVATLLRLVERADVLIEGYRPGVMERLGVGPDPCLERNPRLVYGRMTGWGQSGPLAQAAGHDINYIALAGALACFGRPGAPPVPPLNLIGDMGGGGMLLVVGVLSALLERATSGQGQVIDAAMLDGTTLLMASFWGARSNGTFREQLGTNILDGGAHFYDAYETADGRHVAVGPIEPEFFRLLCERVGVPVEELPHQRDTSTWPELKERFAAIFRTRTRDEWCDLLEGTDTCFAPVLTMTEAARHPHLVARGTIVEHNGIAQPAPAPRFSRTPGAIAGPPASAGEHTDEVLAEWGFGADEVAALRGSGALR